MSGKAKLTSFGARLRWARERADLSLEGLARIASISKTNLHRWEKDSVTPRHVNVVAVSQLLGVRSDWLLTGEGSIDSQREKIWAKYVNGAVGRRATPAELAHQRAAFETGLPVDVHYLESQLGLLRGALTRAEIAKTAALNRLIDAGAVSPRKRRSSRD